MPELVITYQQHHLNLLQNFIDQVQNLAPFNNQHGTEDDISFIERLKALPDQTGEALNTQGQILLCKVVGAYPHLMPILPRDLLWFFGGDCLQFMPDEEAELFQTLDEKRHQAELDGLNFCYPSEKAKHFGLH